MFQIPVTVFSFPQNVICDSCMTDIITQILPDNQMLRCTITLTENLSLLWHLYDSNIQYTSASFIHSPLTVYFDCDDINMTVTYKLSTTVYWVILNLLWQCFWTLPQQFHDSKCFYNFTMTVMLTLLSSTASKSLNNLPHSDSFLC